MLLGLGCDAGPRQALTKTRLARSDEVGWVLAHVSTLTRRQDDLSEGCHRRMVSDG